MEEITQTKAPSRGHALIVASLILSTALATPVLSQDQVEIRIMAVDAYAKAWQDTLVPEFNKEFPNITVTIDATFGPEMLAKQMLDAVAPVPVYDIIFPDDPWVPQLAEIGALVDLRGPEIAAMTDADFDWDDFNPTPLAAGQWEGKQYALPVRSNMLLMFYNRALYEKAGLPAPTPELTWDEFFEQAPKLVQDTDGDGTIDAWAIDTLFNRDGLTPTVWQTIMNSYGGRLLDEEGNPDFNNEIGVKALEMHKRLLDYAPPGALAHGFAESLQAFRQGQVAVMFTWGSVYRATVTDPNVSKLTNGEVGMQTLPVGSVSGGAHRGIWSAGIASKSPNKEAAWTFLQWLTSKEGERTNSQLVGSFPARNSTLSEGARDPWQEDVFPALRHAYDTAAAGQMWRIRDPKSDATQAIQMDEVVRFFSGSATAEDALNVAAEQIAEVLEE